jgi:hypothetical protein
MNNMKNTLVIIIGTSLALLPKACFGLTNQVAVTQSLKFGLLRSIDVADYHQELVNTNHFESGKKIYYVVSTTKVSREVFALPPPNQLLVFNLYDASGNPVQKTKLGNENSSELNVDEVLQELKKRNPFLSDTQYADLLPGKLKTKHHTMVPDRPYFNEMFVPDNYFIITNKGIYTLDVQMRVWTQKTNGQYGIVVSPPVQVQIEKQ